MLESFTIGQLLVVLLLPVAFLHGHFHAKKKHFEMGIAAAFDTLAKSGKPKPGEPKTVVIELEIE